MIVRHTCGQRVRISLDQFHRRPLCPKCRLPVELPRLYRLLSRLLNFKATPKRRVIRNNRFKDIEAILLQLAIRAWDREIRETENATFILSPKTLQTELVGPEAEMRILYSHARKWVPGFDVPYSVPRVVVEDHIQAAGSFTVDSSGFVIIRIAPYLLQEARLRHLVLAHEVCHHLLEQAGVADHANLELNERMTDLAMFVCGFGQVALEGWAISQLTPETVGYLTTAEQDHAQKWVLAARLANNLGGVDISKTSTDGLTPILEVKTALEDSSSDLRQRIPDRRVRERYLRHYENLHPNESKKSLINRILTDYERDRR